jgi:hypothetical protein
MAVNLSPVFGVAGQLFDDNGNPLAGGKIFTYLAGTTTPTATYTSSAGNIAHTNPIVLDGAGRVPSGEIWLTDGITYKFVVQDSANNLIGTYDNLTGINSNFVAFTNSQEIQTATAGQTVFNLTTMQYAPGTNSLTVFVDGVNQYGPGAQFAYIETDSDTVTFVSGLHVGASVKFTTSQLNSSGATDACQVSYTPPFTNAVATSVCDKLEQYVSVKDFGAVGDGSTDDTAAIQDAVDSGQKDIYFPDGIYVVTSVSITNPIRLFGNATVKKSTVTGTAMFDIASNDVEIDGLTFHGASVDTLIPTANTADNAIQVSGTSTPTQFENIKIRNCTINGVAGFGIRIDYASNVWIQSNNILYCGYAGVTLLSVIHGVVDGNRISNIDSSAGAVNWYGISITRDPTQTTTNSARSADCVVTNNVISFVSKWTGIDIHAAHKCVVDSNQVYFCKNGMYAQYDDSVATYKQPSEGVIFSNNFVEGNSAAADAGLGIASLGLATMPNLDITIIGNQVINGGGFASTNGGLYVTETKNCVVSNNICKNSWRSAFSITGACDNVVFESNEINGVQPDGSGSSTHYGYISSASMTNVVLRNNRCYNNTGTSGNTPTYGILYAAGTYSNVSLDKNRILNLSGTSFLFNGSNSNRYQDFSWILEPTPVYDAGWTLTSGNTTETYNVTVRRDVRGTPATSTLIYSLNRTDAANPKVAVVPTAQVSLTQYQLTAYTVDGTAFGAATNIPVMLTVHGICWTD